MRMKQENQLVPDKRMALFWALLITLKCTHHQDSWHWDCVVHIVCGQHCIVPWLTCVQVVSVYIRHYYVILICRLQIDQNEHDINVLEGALEKVRILVSSRKVTYVMMTCLVVWGTVGLWLLSSLWVDSWWGHLAQCCRGFIKGQAPGKFNGCEDNNVFLKKSISWKYFL